MVITILAYYPEVPLNVWVFLCLSPSDLSSMYLRNIPLVKSAYRTNWLISFKKTHLTFLVKTTPPPVWLCLVNVIVSKWRRCVCIGNVKAHPDSKGELSGSEWHIEGVLWNGNPCLLLDWSEPCTVHHTEAWHASPQGCNFMLWWRTFHLGFTCYVFLPTANSTSFVPQKKQEKKEVWVWTL